MNFYFFRTQTDPMILDRHNRFYAKITGQPTSQLAFDELIRRLRDHNIPEPALARVAMRFFKIHLRGPRTNSIDIDKYAWFQMQQSSNDSDDPIGCIFDHDGWIFFGTI
jgi:hypothetical protein